MYFDPRTKKRLQAIADDELRSLSNFVLPLVGGSRRYDVLARAVLRFERMNDFPVPRAQLPDSASGPAAPPGERVPHEPHRERGEIFHRERRSAGSSGDPALGLWSRH